MPNKNPSYVTDETNDISLNQQPIKSNSDTKTIMTRIAKKNIPYKTPNFSAWEQSLKEEKLTFPVFVLDIGAIINNKRILAKTLNDANELAEKTGLNPPRTLRIATKSIRIPEIITDIVTDSPYKGVMCHSVEEAKILNAQGINDILIAYPVVNPEELKILRTLHDSGAKIVLVVDSENHLLLVEEAMKGTSIPFPLIVDMDMSLRYFNGLIHWGTHRSPIRSIDDLENILRASQNHDKYSSIKIIGVMAYDAVVAGCADRSGSGIINAVVNRIKTIVRNQGVAYAAEMAVQIPRLFKKLGMELEIFNGGGTGSFMFAINRPGLTEITAGSAIHYSHRFDGNYSSGIPEGLHAGIYQVLQVTRISDPQPSLASPAYVTCQEGGLIASGPPEELSAPIVVYPKGLTTNGDEGYGEVQTALKVQKGEPLPSIGSLIFTRPSKAGEPLRDVNQVVLMFEDKIVGCAKTIRGFMQAEEKAIKDEETSTYRMAL